jgi:hypothetical protein
MWARVWPLLFRDVLERLERGDLDRLRVTATDRLAALRQPDGIHERLRALFATGVKPP